MSDDLRTTWHALEDETERYVAGDRGAAEKQRLADAADAYAKARWMSRSKSKPSTGKGALSGVVLPFGKEKGVAIEEAKRHNLEWVASAVRENIDDPQRATFRVKNIALLDAIEKELATR